MRREVMDYKVVWKTVVKRIPELYEVIKQIASDLKGKGE